MDPNPTTTTTAAAPTAPTAAAPTAAAPTAAATTAAPTAAPTATTVIYTHLGGYLYSESRFHAASNRYVPTYRYTLGDALGSAMDGHTDTRLDVTRADTEPNHPAAVRWSPVAAAQPDAIRVHSYHAADDPDTRAAIADIIAAAARRLTRADRDAAPRTGPASADPDA